MSEQAVNPWEIEDYLQSKDCFLNGITGKPAHSDSYMTVLDYNNLDGVLQDNPYSLDDWKKAIDYWLTNENMQPPLILAAKAAQRYFKLV